MALVKLGWNIAKPEAGNGGLLEKGEFYSIREFEGGEKRYCISAVPCLSAEEQGILARVSELFQKRQNLEATDAGEAERKGQLKEFFRKHCLENFVLLGKEQVEYLCLALERHVFGFGAMDFLLQDNEIEEIASIGVGEEKPVHVFHRRLGWLRTNLFFSNSDYARELVNRMARSVGRRLSMNSPMLNSTLPDGSRISAAINPVSFSGPSITIRKFGKLPFTPIQLVENNTFSAELMAFLWIAMQCDCSVLIAGNTGSGKTSSLNALLSFVPQNERIVVVEETPEIRLEHKHFVKLTVVKEQNIEMQDLIVESLRMRPDRIIVGEVRSKGEASAFIDTMLAGHGKGSYGTFHGQSVRESLNRMRCLGVLEIDLAAIGLIVVQRRWNKAGKKGNSELRRVVEVAELEEESGKINTLFKFDYTKDRLEKCGESTRVFEKAVRSFSFDRKGWKKELLARKRFLEKNSLKGIEIKEFFKKVNRF